jgi:hypothetical protein
VPVLKVPERVAVTKEPARVEETKPVSPPSPVIIINTSRSQETREEVREDRRSDKPQQLTSTIGKVLHRELPENYDDEDDLHDKRISSVITVKKRVVAPAAKQASKRLFSAQAGFLKNGKDDINLRETQQDDGEEESEEDLRSMLMRRKRKRDITYESEQTSTIVSGNASAEELPPVERKKTRFIVTLDGIERNAPFNTQISLSPNLEELEIDEAIDDVQEQCKYYPNCKNSTCTYFHPSDVTQDVSQQLCKYLPNCQYKSNCKYKHPFCKYAERCTNRSCSYKHPAIHRAPAPKPFYAAPVHVDRTKFKWSKKE